MLAESRVPANRPFQKTDGEFSILGQTIREDTPRGSCTHDDEIKHHVVFYVTMKIVFH